MNKERRKEIDEVLSKLEQMRDVLSGILDDIGSIRDDEESYMENMPENLQLSDRYYAAEEATDNLSSASDEVDTSLNSIEEAIGYLESAKE